MPVRSGRVDRGRVGWGSPVFPQWMARPNPGPTWSEVVISPWSPPVCSGPPDFLCLLWHWLFSKVPVQYFALDIVPQYLMFSYSRIEVMWCSLFDTSYQRKRRFISSNTGHVNLHHLVKVVSARFLHFSVFILSSIHIWRTVSWDLWEADLLESDVYVQFLGSLTINSFLRLCRSTFSFSTASGTSMQFTCNQVNLFISLHSILNYQHIMTELFKFTYT